LYRARPTDLFLAGSAAEADEISAVLGPEASTILIRNPMPLSTLDPDDEHVRRRRASWNLPASSTVLLYAHRIVPNKGLDIAVRSLAELPETVHLVVAGNGSDFATECEALAELLGVADRVMYIGPLRYDEIDEVILAADVFILPARRDTFPLMVLHALACGAPVVVSRTCQSVASLNGAVVPIDPEPTALARAVTDLTPEELNRLARAGRERISADYSTEAVARTLQSFYQRLQGQRAPLPRARSAAEPE